MILGCFFCGGFFRVVVVGVFFVVKPHNGI